MGIADYSAGNSSTPNGSMKEHNEQAASMHSSIEKLADAARPAADRLASAAQQAIDKVAAVAAQAGDKVSATGEQIQDLQARAVEGVRTQIRNKPMMAIGIALAAGFILSRALRQQR